MRTLSPIMATLMLSSVGSSAFAQIEVSAEPVDTEPPVAEATDDLVMTLYPRIQALQSEVAYLQGRVETLEHQIQELLHDQRRRFADLDRRIRELSGGTRIAPVAVAEAPDGSEIALYRAAFALVEAEEFAAAVPEFERLVEQFPNGQYVPDSMYWLGELKASVEPIDVEAARQQFVQLVNLYPDHAKAPAAMYKLGTIYHTLGDVVRALHFLDRVITDYPDHPAARLANSYAEELR